MRYDEDIDSILDAVNDIVLAVEKQKSHAEGYRKGMADGAMATLTVLRAKGYAVPDASTIKSYMDAFKAGM